jgi:hypothetical protein
VELSSRNLDDSVSIMLVWMKAIDGGRDGDEVFMSFGSVGRDSTLSISVQTPGPDGACRVEGERVMFSSINVDDSP